MPPVTFHIMQGVICWQFHTFIFSLTIYSSVGRKSLSSHLKVDYKIFANHLQFNCKALGPCYVIWKMFPHDKTIKSELWLIDDHGESHTRPLNESRPACKELTTKREFSCELITRERNWQVPRPFFMVKYSRGTCEFQWWVPLSYCMSIQE